MNSSDRSEIGEIETLEPCLEEFYEYLKKEIQIPASHENTVKDLIKKYGDVLKHIGACEQEEKDEITEKISEDEITYLIKERESVKIVFKTLVPMKSREVTEEYKFVVQKIYWQPKQAGTFKFEYKAEVTRPLKRKVNVNKVYQFRERLSKGEYGTVNRYYSKLLRKDVAIKIITKVNLSCEQLQKWVPREINILKKLKHPNIIKCIEVFDNTIKIYLVMELAEKGSLTKYIRDRGKLDSVICRKFFSQLVEAVNFCLEQKICHRKICTNNILITKTDVVKLCDFSHARELDSKKEFYDTCCGVVAFTAPEILEGQFYSPYLSEVWSIGVVVYAMVYGVLPFNPTHHASFLKQINTHITFQWFPDTPYACLNLMHNMIAPISRRFNMHMLMNDPWLFDQKPLKALESLPLAMTEPWRETKEKILQLKDKFNEQIMENISTYMTDLQFQKLQRQQGRKKKNEQIPEKMDWLFKFYD